VPAERSDPGGAAADPLAELLWTARAERRVLAPDDEWATVDSRRAAAIAAQLYRRAGADPPSAWKLGALDEPTKTRLGLDRPLVAPVLPDGLHTDAGAVTLDLARLCQPKLEAEVGLVLNGSGQPEVAACVEIADCRFAGWRPPPGVAVADFGLQGAMVFGPARPAPDEVAVEVRNDGRTVATGRAAVTDMTARLDLVRPLLPGGTGRVLVATGAMTPLLDAAPGRWEFVFAGATTITVTLQ
jgi:2-keto-4-pentenoate hydratase